MSTRMACATDLMQQERLSADIFSDKKFLSRSVPKNDQAILTVTDSKGQKRIYRNKSREYQRIKFNYIHGHINPLTAKSQSIKLLGE